MQNIELAEKESFVRSIWLHYVLFQPLAELDQFRSGLLDTLQLELLSITHGEKLQSLLAQSTAFDVTAEYLQESFIALYSDNGSNDRTLEEAIVMHWVDYLDECKGMFLKNIIMT